LPENNKLEIAEYYEIMEIGEGKKEILLEDYEEKRDGLSSEI